MVAERWSMAFPLIRERSARLSRKRVIDRTPCRAVSKRHLAAEKCNLRRLATATAPIAAPVKMP